MSIIDRRTKLKARRLFRKQKRKAEEVSEQADDNINKLVFRRFDRLVNVRRFVAVWVVLVLMLGLGALWQVRALDKYYLESTPVAGGVYREGIIGTFTNANPLFATSSVDTSVSKLVFSGLFKISPMGEIIGDLASSYDVDTRGSVYTVKLREDVNWHDGDKFDSQDVLFTYETVQNPLTRSPLRSSWAGVKVTATDASTVVFTLPNPFSSFPYALVNGIVPSHILGENELEDLRSSSFNTVSPIGTGPFKLSAVEVSGNQKDERQERIALTRNNEYFGSVPGINSVVIRSYNDEESMINDFEEKAIQSMVGLSSVSDKILEEDTVRLQQAPLMSSVMIFFNNSNEFLEDKNLRQALVYATDNASLRQSIGYSPVSVDSPFLKNHFAYNPEITQLAFDLEKANEKFNEAGWVLGEDGIREKEGKKLRFRFVSQSLTEYSTITQKLQEDWAKIGVSIDAVLQPEEDIQRNALARHDYDIFLYGISIGYDPDVFAYWHTSQIDPNSSSLNLSEYSNEVSDEALEAGRTRVDETLRKVKYNPFLSQWREDAPAIALYQPRFVMVTRGTFEGFNNAYMSTATDRYWSISDWRIRNTETVKE